MQLFKCYKLIVVCDDLAPIPEVSAPVPHPINRIDMLASKIKTAISSFEKSFHLCIPS